MNDFSPKECIRFGWETFKLRPWFFIGVFLLITLVSGVSNFQNQTNNTTQFTPTIIILLIIGVVAAAFIQMLVRMGQTQFVLKTHEAPGSVSFRDLWAPHPFWKFVGATILVGLITVAGFILLIVPGIIWGLRYMFVPYLVIERKLGPLEALAESSRITYGYKWQLLGLLGLIFLVNLLGFVCLLVGLFVSIPVTAFALVHAFRTLEQKAGAAPVVA